MAKMRQEIDMTEGPLFGKILQFAFPLMLSGILQCLYNAADTAVVGSVSEYAVGAVGSTGALVNLLVNLFISLAVGTSITVAISVGARDRERTQRLLHTSMALSLVCGAIITAVGYTGARTFLVWMGTNEELLDGATNYLRIYFLGSIFSMVYNFGAAVLRSAGDSRHPLYFLAISGAVNVLLNLFFVHVVGMVEEGVALATVASQVLSAVMVVGALMKYQKVCHLELRHIRFYKKELLDILKTGLPASIQSLVFSLSNTIIQVALNSFRDPLVIAGNTAASNIDNFIYNAMYAFRTTAVTAVGQNVGACKFKRINRIMVICMASVTVTGLLVGGIALLFRYPLLAIFLPNSPGAVEYGVLRLFIMGGTYFTCGWMDTAVGFSQGMGNTFVPMVVAISGVCGVRILWIFTIFQAAHSLATLYLSYTVSWVLTAVAQLLFAIMVKKRMEKRTDVALME